MTANRVLWSVNEDLFTVESYPVDPKTGIMFSDTTGALMRLVVKLKRDIKEEDYDGPYGPLVSVHAIQVKPGNDIIGRVWAINGFGRGIICEPNELKSITVSEDDRLRAGTVVVQIDFYKLASLTF